MTKLSKKSLTKRIEQFLGNRTAREKVIIGITLLVAVGYYGTTLPLMALQEYLTEQEDLAQVRKKQLEETVRYLAKYRDLDAHLKRLKSTFDELQLTFGQVYDRVDKIVKESIGNDNYVLKRSHDPEPLLGSTDYEKQDFTLSVKALSLEQLVKLLYELEKGDTPLVVGKVNIKRSFNKGELQVELEIGSLAKRQNQPPAPLGTGI